MAVYEVPEGYRIALIATMPRSGTWFSFYFIEFLDLFLAGREKINTRLDLHVYHGLRLGKLHTHCICPGFLEACDGEQRANWDALEFYTPGFDYGYAQFVKGNEDVFSPLINPAIRIVYLYRNPLDQIVSFYRHIQKHRQVTTRSRLTESGDEVAFDDVKDFLRSGGLESYIKQYWTYQFMGQRAPEQLLMLPYEDLVLDPQTGFRRLVAFLDLPPSEGDLKEAFRKSLNATKPESLRNLERAMGTSLGRDQTDDRESHIRGGQIGKWTDQLDENDLDYVRHRMTEFGLDIGDFRTS